MKGIDTPRIIRADTANLKHWDEIKDTNKIRQIDLREADLIEADLFRVSKDPLRITHHL